MPHLSITSLHGVSSMYFVILQGSTAASNTPEARFQPHVHPVATTLPHVLCVHPSIPVHASCRYRTTMCTSGEACTRNICFFAHNQQELRTPPEAMMQQWVLPGAPNLSSSAHVSASSLSQPMLDPNELTLHMLCLGQQQSQMQAAGPTDPTARLPLAVSASSPLPATFVSVNWAGACGLSSTNQHSSRLPVVSVGVAALPAASMGPAAGPWAASVLSPQGSAGTLGYSPSLNNPSPAAQGMQLQMLLQDSQQQLDPGMYAAMPSPQATPSSCGLQSGGVASYAPVSAALAANLQAGMVPAAAMTGTDSPGLMALGPQQQQEWLLLQQQQAKQHQQQYPAAVPALNSTASAAGTSSGHTLSPAARMMALTPGNSAAQLQAIPGVAGSMGDLQGLQDMAWQQQQQQAAAMQQAVLLLQQMQLAGGRPPVPPSTRLSSDSVTSTLLGSSSSYSTGPLRLLSQLTMSDLSNESLASFLPAGYFITQDISLGSNSAVYLGSGPLRSHSTQLLPLQSAGLIQMSALDDGPSALDQAQQQQQCVTMPLTMPMALPVAMPGQQQGRYW